MATQEIRLYSSSNLASYVIEILLLHPFWYAQRDKNIEKYLVTEALIFTV